MRDSFKILLSFLLLAFIMVGCQKYEIVPNAEAEDNTLRHQDLLNEHIFNLQDDKIENDLRDLDEFRPDDDDDLITDDDDEDEDSEENQDMTVNQ